MDFLTALVLIMLGMSVIALIFALPTCAISFAVAGGVTVLAAAGFDHMDARR